jgi:hypothetical protein
MDSLEQAGKIAGGIQAFRHRQGKSPLLASRGPLHQIPT